VIAGRLATAVLFDLDGTLIDSIELIRRSFRHMLLEHGFDGDDDSIWRRGIGRPLDVQLAEIARDPGDVAAMLATYRAYNSIHHDELVSVFPGVRESLEALARAGRRLGVVTSKARTGALRGLAHTGLESFFDVVVAANDAPRPKPAPDPVLAALATLGVEPARATTVGDALPDLQAGRAAGTRTVAVLWGACDRSTLEAATPDLFLDDPRALGTL
jgi:pyrophosphatase PpaX